MPEDRERSPTGDTTITQCQSCGRVLESARDRGTDRSGARVAAYCSTCYRGGAFTEPAVTMAELVARRAARLACEIGRPRSEVTRDLCALLPRLDRWRETTALAGYVARDTRRLRRLHVAAREKRKQPRDR